MKCKLRTRRGLEVTSWVRQWQVVHQEPLGTVWSCFGITWSLLGLLWDHLELCGCVQGGQPRGAECPQWWAFIFTWTPSRNFLLPLTHSSQLGVFVPPESFSHQFFFHFPQVPAGSLNHNLQFLKTEGTFLHSRLVALGFETYCLLFYFLTKSNVSLT